jgi:hypothetical protein
MFTYEQSTGRLLDPHGILSNLCYSGAFGPNQNNPASQSIPDEGPIPEGFYTMDTPYDHGTKGSYFIPLIPDGDNVMFGRGSFACHGERLLPPPGYASDGCIISSPIEKRQAMWTSGDHRLQVVAGSLQQ